MVTGKLSRLLSSETLSCYQRVYRVENPIIKNVAMHSMTFKSSLVSWVTVDTLKISEAFALKQFR